MTFDNMNFGCKPGHEANVNGKFEVISNLMIIIIELNWKKNKYLHFNPNNYSSSIIVYIWNNLQYSIILWQPRTCDASEVTYADVNDNFCGARILSSDNTECDIY